MAVVDSLPLSLIEGLRGSPRRWLLTGAAGFIGSHLLETLLRLDQHVVSVDNFATGKRGNLDEVRDSVGAAAWARHQFIEGDLVDPGVCREACRDAEIVLHQAALGSVPRSIDDPLASVAANVTAFVNLLHASHQARVATVVYASSSSVYGDHPSLPKVESVQGEPLSPYAATKRADELFANAFAHCYGLAIVGLRYFNVFGARQDPNGPYAAVIPRWVEALLREQICTINGDGHTSRDFCYVANAVQANLLAALKSVRGRHVVVNIACEQQTTLNDLHSMLSQRLSKLRPGLVVKRPIHGASRAGDVRHSLASIEAARKFLGYEPTHDVARGLDEALIWYGQHIAADRVQRAA